MPSLKPPPYQVIFPCWKKMVACDNLTKRALVFTKEGQPEEWALFQQIGLLGKLLHRCVAGVWQVCLRCLTSHL